MLNELQRQILTNFFNSYILFKLSDLDETTAYHALCSITNDSIYYQHKYLFQRIGILEGIDYFRTILSHPFPQNVSVSQEDVPSDSVVKYRNFNGEVVIEPKGILGLSSLNDDSVKEPVMRRDVIQFVNQVVEKEREARVPTEQVFDLDSGMPAASATAVVEMIVEDGDDNVVDGNSGDDSGDNKDNHNSKQQMTSEETEERIASPEMMNIELRSNSAPNFEQLSTETQQYWASLVKLLNSDHLFRDYNEVKNVWNAMKDDQQQKVLIELQSMIGECLILYDTLINLLLKFAIARTSKTFNASDFSEYIQRLNQEQSSNAQTNLLCLSYFSRALSYCINKDYEESIQDYTKAIALHEAAIVYNNRGMSYYCLKKFTEAMKDLNVAIKMKPDYAMAYYNRSLCYEATDRIFEAQQDAKKAYVLQTNNTDFQARYKTLRNLIEGML